jgi:divalent metal cation (Fe/Co/Zn/Cd) transporter
MVVLGISILLELGSFVVAFGEFNKGRRGRSVREALFSGKDPVIPLVLLEDAGAVFGLLLALASIIITALTGSSISDAVGSILIGALLCTIGLLLAKDTRSLLIGESIDEYSKAEIMSIVNATPGVQAVTQVLSLQLGPEAALLALKVRFEGGFQLADVERVIDELEARVRAAYPAMKRIFVEPDGDYDATRDPDYAG